MNCLTGMLSPLLMPCEADRCQGYQSLWRFLCAVAHQCGPHGMELAIPGDDALDV